MASTRWSRLGALVVLAFFGLPLFVGLGQQDLRTDEAIYSYSVDRMIETGDWLTPRSSPLDGPFLEKPPLKTWVVAGLIASGVVPHDERGMRFADALFGALALLYVYALGCLLAGPMCGVAAAFVCFTFASLVFEHGVRSNNMEAALVLAYAGGLYHFTRWDSLRGTDNTAARTARGTTEVVPYGKRRATLHALAVAVWFAVGFLMKFVAMLFLPIVCVLALLWRARAARPQLGELWRAWRWPAVLALALCAPWFIAAWRVHGRLVWDVMFGAHVYTRLTASLDPTHLAPWSAYFEWIWGDFVQAGTAWVVLPGLLLVAYRAVTGAQDARPVHLARLLLLWAIVPLALMSIGTSKLPHYAYPFLPPFALAGGYLVATLVALVIGALGALGRRRDPGHAVDSGQAKAWPSTDKAWPSTANVWLSIGRRLLVVVGIVSLVIAVWTVMTGDVSWHLGGGLRFRNASAARPLVLGVFLVWLGAAPLARLHAWVVVPLLVLFVMPGYEHIVDRLRREDRPLSALRACVEDVQHAHPDAAQGVYNAARGNVTHPFAFYLRAIGPLEFKDLPEAAELRQRLRDASPEPMIVSRDQLIAVIRALSDDSEALHSPVSWVTDRDGTLSIVLPGPYRSCVLPVVAQGWVAAGDQ